MDRWCKIISKNVNLLSLKRPFISIKNPLHWEYNINMWSIKTMWIRSITKIRLDVKIKKISNINNKIKWITNIKTIIIIK